LWETHKPATTLATWKQLNEFLKKRCCVLEAISNNKNITSKKFVTTTKPQNTTAKPSKTFVTSDNTNLKNCIVCQKEHPIYKCDKFKEINVLKNMK
jgi:hypothetical protein